MEKITRSDIENIVKQIIENKRTIIDSKKTNQKKVLFQTKSIDWLCIIQFTLMVSIIITTNNRNNNTLNELGQKMQYMQESIEQLFQLNANRSLHVVENTQFNVTKFIEKANATVTNTINSLVPSLLNDNFIERMLKRLILRYSYEISNHLYWLNDYSLQIKTINDTVAYYHKAINGFPVEESTTFNLIYFALISNWIGYQCKFKLLYRASKDGYTANAFHEKCDGKFPTVTIIKNTAGKIFGGYTPLAWESPLKKDIWIVKADKHLETFIFSINMKAKFNLKNPTKAIMCHHKYGPCFGGYRIAIGDNCNTQDSSVANSIDDKNYEPAPLIEFLGSEGIAFTVDDYEVFEIVN